METTADAGAAAAVMVTEASAGGKSVLPPIITHLPGYDAATDTSAVVKHGELGDALYRSIREHVARMSERYAAQTVFVADAFSDTTTNGVTLEQVQKASRWREPRIAMACAFTLDGTTENRIAAQHRFMMEESFGKEIDTMLLQFPHAKVAFCVTYTIHLSRAGTVLESLTLDVYVMKSGQAGEGEGERAVWQSMA